MKRWKQLTRMFVDSWMEMKQVRTLVAMAMLMSVAVVLGFYTLQLSEYLKFGFSFIANELAGMLFGPVAGGIMAGAADLVKFLVKPTGPFFFGFTFNAILAGVIYGLILYKKQISVKRIFCANLAVSVIVNMFLATYFISMLYGTPFTVLFPVRAIKQLIMLPIETMLYYVVAKALYKTKIFTHQTSRYR